MSNIPSLEQRWKRGDTSVLNIAAFCPGTTVLGPGKRAVVWVQGCARNCPGCYAPSYQLFQPANLVAVEDLALEILQNPDIEGVTFSGGEPILQSNGLALLMDLLRKERPGLNFSSYTGYLLKDLQQEPLFSRVSDFLSRLDVLIDGPYIQELDDGRTGLKGSRNQTVHYLTQRLRHFDFDECPRRSEVMVKDQEILLVGVPSRGFRHAMQDVALNLNTLDHKLVLNVRA